MMWALISPTFSFIRSWMSLWPLMMASRASRTQSGQSESVSRGQPSVGLLFCQDFSKGLSVHLGVMEGLGLYLLKNLIDSKAPWATTETVASTYFNKRLAA